MYIKYFKLLSDYKGLRSGLELQADNKNILVLTGKNGNGKSIILEVLQLCLYKALININYNDSKFFIPRFELHLEVNQAEFRFKLKSNYWELLPAVYFKTNIISLTSGINEQLSSFPNYLALNEITYTRDNMLAGFSPDFSNQRNLYISRRKSKIYFLINSIFNFDQMKEFLISRNIEEMHFKKLTNFSMNIDIPKYRKMNSFGTGYDTFYMTLPPIVKDTLERLYCIKENWLHFPLNYNIYDKLTFDFNELQIEKIKEFFGINPKTLFDVFNYLENLNLINMTINERDICLRESKENITERFEEAYTSISFYVNDIIFDNSISFKNISDGEMQLLESLGTISFYKLYHSQEKFIFLFDEPETHLNVTWKKKYGSLIQDLCEGNNFSAQLVLTTHNPEVIADFKKENIFYCEDSTIKPIDFNPFGGTIENVNHNLFNSEFMSSKSHEVYLAYFDKIVNINLENDLINLKEEIISCLSDSPARMNLLMELQKKIRGLR